MLVPPSNFGMVEEELYRSGAPDLINLPFLEKLQLKSLLWLAPEEPDRQLYVHREGSSMERQRRLTPPSYAPFPSTVRLSAQLTRSPSTI